MHMAVCVFFVCVSIVCVRTRAMSMCVCLGLHVRGVGRAGCVNTPGYSIHTWTRWGGRSFSYVNVYSHSPRAL